MDFVEQAVSERAQNKPKPERDIGQMRPNRPTMFALDCAIDRLKRWIAGSGLPLDGLFQLTIGCGDQSRIVRARLVSSS